MSRNFTEQFDELGVLIDAVMLLDKTDMNQWQRYVFKTAQYTRLSLNKNNAHTYIEIVVNYIDDVLKAIKDEVKRAAIELELAKANVCRANALADDATEAQAIQARLGADAAKVAVDNIINPPE